MRCFVLCAVSIGLAACGGSDAECVIDTDCPVFQRCEENACAPLGAVDGGGGHDGGAAVDGGGVDAAISDGGAPARGVGTIAITQIPLDVSGMDFTTFSMSASFSETADTTCARTMLGTCVTLECPIAVPSMDDGGVVDDGGTPMVPHAGTISLVGGTQAASVMPNASGIYDVASGSGRVFAASAALTVMATGGGVPAFAQMTTAPGDITVTAPSFAAPIALSRTDDLVLTWTAVDGLPGQVQAELAGSEATRYVSVTCAFDPALMTATIPSTVLTALPAGSGTIAIYTRSGATMPAGRYDVTLQVKNAATTDTAMAALGTTTIP